MTIRKTYDLPAPTNTYNTFSTWFTAHSVEIDGILRDGGVLLDHSKGVIDVETHESEVLTLDYNEAERVALALLAAVEEAETMKENQ